MKPSTSLPRLQPVEAPESYLQAVVQWHFSPVTGSPYWAAASQGARRRPADRCEDLEGLTHFPNVVDELLDVPARDIAQRVPGGRGQ